MSSRKNSIYPTRSRCAPCKTECGVFLIDEEVLKLTTTERKQRVIKNKAIQSILDEARKLKW